MFLAGCLPTLLPNTSHHISWTWPSFITLVISNPPATAAPLISLPAGGLLRTYLVIYGEMHAKMASET